MESSFCAGENWVWVLGDINTRERARILCLGAWDSSISPGYHSIFMVDLAE